MATEYYQREQVEACRLSLAEIAKQPRTSFNKRQVVAELLDDIEEALKVRSYDEVATFLTEQGFDISTGALKQYVSRIKSERKASSSKRKRATRRKQQPTQAEKNKAATQVERAKEPTQTQVKSRTTARKTRKASTAKAASSKATKTTNIKATAKRSRKTSTTRKKAG